MTNIYYIKDSNPLQVAEYFVQNQFYYDRDGNAYLGVGNDFVELKLIAKSALTNGSISFLSTDIKPGRRISELDMFWRMSAEYSDPNENKYLREILEEEGRRKNIKANVIIK